MLHVSGKTEDGKQVVAGFFTMIDEKGVPLTVVLDYFNENDLIPNWIDFLQETVKSNWNASSTLEKINEACFEIYGANHRDIVIKNLKLWITDNW